MNLLFMEWTQQYFLDKGGTRMYNTLFTIGPFSIRGYGLMIAIGILAAYYVAEKRAANFGLQSNKILSLVMWCLLGGMAGAKLLYLVVSFEDIKNSTDVLRTISNGFVVYGGIVVGIATGLIWCIKNKFNFFKYFDLLMPSVAFAQGFGRIGCFLAGCCYGKETTSAIGIVFQESNYAVNGVPLIPTQLISSALDFFHFAILLLVAKYSKKEGQVAAVYLVLYSIGRFALEYLRGDLERGMIGRFTTSQTISIYMLVVGIIFFIWRTWFAKSNERYSNCSEK